MAEGDTTWKRSFYILWVAEVIAIIGFQVVQPFLPYYIQELGVDDLSQAVLWSGRMGTAAGLAMAISSPIWGALADRFGRKPMVGRAMVGGGVAALAMAYVSSVEGLLATRLLQGALAGTVTACITLVSTTTPRPHLGFALGMMQGAFMFGAALGPIAGGPLISRFGYHTCFVVSGVLVLMAGLAVHIFVRESFTRAEGSKGGGREMWRDAVRLLRDPPFRLVLVAVTLMQFAFAVIMPVIPLFLQALAKTDHIEALAGPIFGASMLAGGISSVVTGKWGERVGAKRAMQSGLIGVAVFYTAQGLSTSVSMLAVLLVLGGAVSGAIRPVANTLIARIVPEADRGKAFGVVTSAAALGWAAGPLAGGSLAAEAGFRTVFFVTAALFVALAVWVWFSMRGIGEPSRRQGSTTP